MKKILLTLMVLTAPIWANAIPIQRVKTINPTTIEIWYTNNQHYTLDFYGENIFRVFQDNAGGIIRAPKATPEAQILVDNPRKPINQLDIEENENKISILTEDIKDL